MITGPPRTRPVPATVNGQGAAVRRRRCSTPRPRSASQHPGHRPGAGVRVTVEGDRPSARAATGGTNRITVPARPQSTAPPCSGPGVTGQSSSGGVDGRPERGQRRGHQLGVARAQGAAYDGRAVGQRGQHQRAVGQRLRAGQLDARVDRAARHAAPATGRCGRRGVSPRPEAIGRCDFAASLASSLASRRRCLAWRRAPVAAFLARQATPGTALGVDRGEQQPTEHREVLEEVELLVGLRGRVGLVPELVTGHGRRHQRGGQHRAGEPRSAPAGQGGGGQDLRGGVDRGPGSRCPRGSCSCGAAFSSAGRIRSIDGLGLRGEGGSVLQRADPADDERRGEQRTGEQSGDCHGYIITRSPSAQPGRSAGRRPLERSRCVVVAGRRVGPPGGGHVTREGRASCPEPWLWNAEHDAGPPWRCRCRCRRRPLAGCRGAWTCAARWTLAVTRTLWPSGTPLTWTRTCTDVGQCPSWHATCARGRSGGVGRRRGSVGSVGVGVGWARSGSGSWGRLGVGGRACGLGVAFRRRSAWRRRLRRCPLPLPWPFPLPFPFRPVPCRCRVPAGFPVPPVPSPGRGRLGVVGRAGVVVVAGVGVLLGCCDRGRVRRGSGVGAAVALGGGCRPGAVPRRGRRRGRPRSATGPGRAGGGRVGASRVWSSTAPPADARGRRGRDRRPRPTDGRRSRHADRGGGSTPARCRSDRSLPRPDERAARRPGAAPQPRRHRGSRRPRRRAAPGPSSAASEELTSVSSR